MLSFGWLPGVWILYADVSEHCLFHIHWHAATCLWRWNRVFRNVGIYISDPGESPKRKHKQTKYFISKHNEDGAIAGQSYCYYLWQHVSCVLHRIYTACHWHLARLSRWWRRRRGKLTSCVYLVPTFKKDWSSSFSPPQLFMAWPLRKPPKFHVHKFMFCTITKQIQQKVII